MLVNGGTSGGVYLCPTSPDEEDSSAPSNCPTLPTSIVKADRSELVAARKRKWNERYRWYLNRAMLARATLSLFTLEPRSFARTKTKEKSKAELDALHAQIYALRGMVLNLEQDNVRFREENSSLRQLLAGTKERSRHFALLALKIISEVLGPEDVNTVTSYPGQPSTAVRPVAEWTGWQQEGLGDGLSFLEGLNVDNIPDLEGGELFDGSHQIGV